MVSDILLNTISLSFVLFFLFIGLTLTLTITSKNAIIAILYLILFFFSLSLLFIFCGADYIGILFLLLYAGAISIIFLFVVMFLDMKELSKKKERYSGMIFLVYLLFFAFSSYKLIEKSFLSFINSNNNLLKFFDWNKIYTQKDNIETIGFALYENYLFQFLSLGFVLFLIMVLIISLLINYNRKTKKQKLHQQLFFKIETLSTE